MWNALAFSLKKVNFFCLWKLCSFIIKIFILEIYFICLKKYNKKLSRKFLLEISLFHEKLQKTLFLGINVIYKSLTFARLHGIVTFANRIIPRITRSIHHSHMNRTLVWKLGDSNVVFECYCYDFFSAQATSELIKCKQYTKKDDDFDESWYNYHDTRYINYRKSTNEI